MFWLYKKLIKYSEFNHLCAVIQYLMHEKLKNFNKASIYLDEDYYIEGSCDLIYFILNKYGEEKLLKIFRYCLEKRKCINMKYNGIILHLSSCTEFIFYDTMLN